MNCKNISDLCISLSSVFGFSLAQTYKPKELRVEIFSMFLFGYGSQLRISLWVSVVPPEQSAVHHYSFIYMHDIYLHEKSWYTRKDQDGFSAFI